MDPASFPYRVLPRTYACARVELEQIQADAGGPGCVGVIAFVVLAFVGMAILSSSDLNLPTDAQDRYTPIVLAGALAIGGAVFAFSLRSQRRKWLRHAIEKKLAREDAINKDQRIAASKEAEATTRRLHQLLDTSYKAAAAIPVNLESVCRCIPLAEREFADNAYAPFWDAVERAAELLAAISEDLRMIGANACEYQQLLKEREHDFPRFPIALNVLPNPRASAEALAAVVRRGQTVFEFASIWEQRKMRQVLIGGFRTIAETIADATSAVIGTYSDVSSALCASLDVIDSRLASTADHAARMVDLQERVLDSVRRPSSA